MTTKHSIEVHATPADIFSLVADVENWPRILPHYRYVKILEASPDRRVAVMAARRDWINVRWTAAQRLLPNIPRVEFTHVGGWTTGMTVAWMFDAIPEGTRVTVSHDLSSLRLPLVRSSVGRRIVADFFIGPIVSRTLARMKATAEAQHG